ncbi:hypothetical protein PIB30_067941 [Stylosanthes scabra]|uniref:Ubiquitin-like protease family profile domain-containing protein n=1 Tax=Stylosanthes scabra TaxID=79078 RepID=A0ABU6VMJ4_9FABA|nr:hypothetical protein [Stylosanthes scabra]
MEDLDQATIDAQIEAYRVVEARAQACKEAVPQAEPDPEDLFDADPQDIIEAQVQAAEEAEARHRIAKERMLIKNFFSIRASEPAMGLMMVASVAANEEEYDPAKAFDLGLEPQPLAREIPVELYNLDDFPEEVENPVTPTIRAPIVPLNVIAAEPSQVNNDLKERCVIWALSNKKEIWYDTIFRIKGDWHYEVVRKQFRSMGNDKEIDLASSMFRKYNDDYIDHRTRRPHSITSLVSDDHLNLVDKAKLITHRYIFAPVLYAKHWWLYILVKSKKTFYVLDSKIKVSPSQERTKIHKFGCNIIDQLLVYAGHHSLLAKATKKKNVQITFIPRHIDIHEQPNEFDYGTFVMKWMEVIDPTWIDPTKPYLIDAWSTEDLQKFRKEMIWQIILSKENLYVQKAIDGAKFTTIHRPSAALQSPYVQVSTRDLKS